MLARIDGHVFSACTNSPLFTFLRRRLLQQVLRGGLGVRSRAQNEIIVIDWSGNRGLPSAFSFRNRARNGARRVLTVIHGQLGFREILNARRLQL